MQAGKLTNSRQLRKLSGRKSIGGRQSMSGGVRSSAMARGSFVAHIRKTRSEESEKNLGNGLFGLKIVPKAEITSNVQRRVKMTSSRHERYSRRGKWDRLSSCRRRRDEKLGGSRRNEKQDSGWRSSIRTSYEACNKGTLFSHVRLSCLIWDLPCVIFPYNVNTVDKVVYAWAKTKILNGNRTGQPDETRWIRYESRVWEGLEPFADWKNTTVEDETSEDESNKSDLK